LHQDRKREEAYTLYQSVLKEHPDHPDALHLLGILAFQTGNDAQGESLIARAVALRPGYREAEANLASFQRKDPESRHEHEITYQNEAPTTWSPDRAQLVDEWRHNRMLDFVACLKEKPDASWLTIGDAYGNDLIRLARFGITNVMPSNLTTTSLELNRKAGFIPRYLKINAEKIELADASYDLVLCKEATITCRGPFSASKRCCAWRARR
jgi:tetratricopeptide (TPR) repeat protein